MNYKNKSGQHTKNIKNLLLQLFRKPFWRPGLQKGFRVPTSKLVLSNLFSLLIPLVLVCFFSIPSFASASLTDGLVGYWTFDGKDTNWAANTTADKSGNGNTGTMTSMSTTSSPVAGKVGQGLRFNGSTQQVLTNGTSGVTNPTDLSVSVWVYIKFYSTATFVSNRTGSNNGFTAGTNGSGAARFTIQNVASYDSSTLSLNKWNNVVYVFTGNTITFYLNGVKLSGPTATGSMTTGDVIFLGNSLNGSLDDVRIYNRALSASEVQQLYKTGATKLGVTTGGAPTNPLNNGLVGWWTFDGKDTNWAANTTADKSGNGNTGTLTNMSTTTSPAKGKIGQGLKFDGVDDYINNADVSLTGPFTVSYWYKRPNTNVVMVLSGSGTRKWGFNGVSPFFRIISSTDSSLSAPSLNTWNMITVVRDSSDIVVGYVNGAGPTSMFAGAAQSGTTEIVSLGRSESDGQYWNGNLDEIRIYNRALSASEVQQLYKTGATKLGVTTGGAPTNPLNNGLVGWWTFDGKDTNWAANTTADKSGNGNTGTLTNMSTTTSPARGKIGQGLNFDGVNDRILFGTNFFSTTDATQPYTVCFWIKTTFSGTAEIVSQYSNAGDASRFNFRILGDKIVWWKAGGSLVTSVSSINDNKWRYICARKSGSGSNQTVIFINGQSEIAGTDSSTYENTNTTIGATTNGLDFFPGQLDDIRIYNIALASSTIQQLYKQGTAKRQ